MTKQRIDLTHGFAGSSIDTIDLRRVQDMHFHRSIFQMCCNRGTITFHSANDSLPILELTTFNAQALYHKIKDVSPHALISPSCLPGVVMCDGNLKHQIIMAHGHLTSQDQFLLGSTVEQHSTSPSMPTLLCSGMDPSQGGRGRGRPPSSLSRNPDPQASLVTLQCTNTSRQSSAQACCCQNVKRIPSKSGSCFM